VDYAQEFPKLTVTLLAAEDHRFFEHSGVDIIAIMRAVVSNAIGRPLQGASTLEQQLVRHQLSDLRISYSRKFRDACVAAELNRHYSKRQLLNFYFVFVYFGSSVQGVTRAAHLLGISLSTASIEQLALLVACLKYPIPDTPTSEYMSRLIARADRIAGRVTTLKLDLAGINA
jgi:membrane peptidoglycan carboxypeptidase